MNMNVGNVCALLVISFIYIFKDDKYFIDVYAMPHKY